MDGLPDFVPTQLTAGHIKDWHWPLKDATSRYKPPHMPGSYCSKAHKFMCVHVLCV